MATLSIMIIEITTIITEELVIVTLWANMAPTTIIIEATTVVNAKSKRCITEHVWRMQRLKKD